MHLVCALDWILGRRCTGVGVHMVSPFLNMRCARTGDSIGASAEVREALAAKNGALTQRQAATAGPTATSGTRFRGKRANQDSQACTSPHLPGRFSNIYQCSVVEVQKHILTPGMRRPHRRTSAETTQRRRPKAATRFNLRGTETTEPKTIWASDGMGRQASARNYLRGSAIRICTS